MGNSYLKGFKKGEFFPYVNLTLNILKKIRQNYSLVTKICDFLSSGLLRPQSCPITCPRHMTGQSFSGLFNCSSVHTWALLLPFPVAGVQLTA